MQEAHEERHNKLFTQNKEEGKDDNLPAYGFDCNQEAGSKEDVIKELAR